MRKIKYKYEGGETHWRLVSYTKQKLSAVCLVLLLLQANGGGLLHIRDELVLVQLGDRATASMCWKT